MAVKVEADTVLASGGPELDSALASASPIARDEGVTDPAESVPSSSFEGGPGKHFGRYVVLGELGHGGMGTVLRAYDETLDRKIAIKVLHTETSDRHTKRLLREAQAMAKLSHPNVVQVYEVDKFEGQAFIAMELVRGEPLDRWQAERRPWRECAQVYLQVGQGLAAAHDVGLVHRDFKPSNCIIDTEGRARVLDFGLAREVELPSDPGTVELSPSDDALSVSLTRTGAVLGTLAYMPFEQLQGQPADERADQFSFCVSLYEAVYGERPFEGRAAAQLIMSLGQGVIRPAPRGTKVPAALRRVLLRGLATRPEERWESMHALLQQLRRLLRPRRTPVVVAGSVALGLVGVGLWSQAQAGSPCEGASEHLRSVWGDEQRQQVEAAIVGTGLLYAPDTWVRVQVRLDGYADAWVDKHTEVCEATNVRGEQSAEALDLRMACLHRRKVALRQTVQVLAEADEGRVETAVPLVDALPGLSRCDDLDALQAELPPPEDPQVQSAVDAHRERLEEVRTLVEAGDYGKARSVVDAVFEQAEALAYPPLQAEALYRRGTVLVAEGEYDDASTDLEHAYMLSAQHGHGLIAMEAALDLMAVSGVRQAKVLEGQVWGKTALALARGRMGGPRTEAGVYRAMASIASTQGQYDQALEDSQRALAIYEQHDGPENLQVGMMLNNVGTMLLKQGQLSEALEHYQRSQEIIEGALGPRHPRVSVVVQNIGNVLEQQGKLPEALGHLKRALSIAEEAHGPRHPRVAEVLVTMATVRRRQGHLDESLADQRRALAIYEHALGPTHPSVARSLDSIGGVLRRQGREQEALEHRRRALAIREEVLGPDHPLVASSLHNIGNALRRQGKLDEALAVHQRALSIRRRSLRAGHPKIGYSLEALGDLEFERGDEAEAREHLEEAVALLERARGRPERLADARESLAKALWPDPSARSRARVLAEQARQAYEQFGDAEDVAEVARWLAEHPSPRR